MDDLKFFGCVILCLSIIIGLAAGMLFIENKISESTDKKNWNNGIHADCGGHWQYEQAVGLRSTIEYIYICDKCNVRETFREIR